MSRLDFTISTENLTPEYHIQKLALEASVLSNVFDTFREGIPALADKLSDIANSFKLDSYEVSEARKFKQYIQKLDKKFKEVNFLDYSKMAVPVPEGFEGSIFDYIKDIYTIAPDIYNDANKIIGEYNFVLSSFITNKENKVSLKDHQDIFHRIQRRRLDSEKVIDQYFNPKSTLSRRPFSTVINNFNEFEEIADISLKLASIKVNLSQIKESVKQTNDLLSIIVDQVKTGALSEVGGNAAMNISNGAYEVAKYVEFIALFHYRAQTVMVSVKEIASLVESKI